MATKNKVENLKESYIQAASLQVRVPFGGRPATAEKRYNTLIEAYQRILIAGEQQILLDLLTHEIHSVRAWAATHSLPIDEKKAHKVLEDLSREHQCDDKFCDSFAAELTLKEWDKGPLKEYLQKLLASSQKAV